MEQDHITALERDRAPLPQVLQGTSYGATSPYTQSAGNQSSGTTYYNAKPQEENKQLLDKLREGM